MNATVQPLAEGLHQLRLEGRSANPHWVLSLFSGLSREGVSIVAGRATRGDQRHWRAEFDLDFAGTKTPPGRLDYESMTRQPVEATAAEAPRLSRWAVVRTSDGSLELTVEGPDQIGFLGRLLAKLSGVGLFPVAMEINTVAGRIQDRFELRGIGGASPSATVERVLATILDRALPA
jgi:hypothetical protein